MITLRRLDRGEFLLFRDLRLEALRDAPEAFASTHEDALKRSDESWRTQADQAAQGKDRATFVAIDLKPIGLVSLYRLQELSDTTELIQMWVAPDYRSKGTAMDLVAHAVKWAEDHGYRRIQLSITANNRRAFRFYEKCGFNQVSRESAPGSTVDMELVLNPTDRS